jgi:hypothetical protein
MDVLQKHLEHSEAMIPITERVDKGKGTLKQSILAKAEKLQKASEVFNNFADELITLDNIKATEQDKVSFFNKLYNQYLNLKGRQNFLTNKLDEFKAIRSDVLEDVGLSKAASEKEIDASNNRRVKFINKKVRQVEASIEQINESIEEIWDNEKVNELFSRELAEKSKLKQEAENVENVNEEIEKIKQINTLEELKKVKTSNPAVAAAIEKKKKELEKQRRDKAQAARETNRYNAPTTSATNAAAQNASQNYNVGETITLP